MRSLPRAIKVPLVVISSFLPFLNSFLPSTPSFYAFLSRLPSTPSFHALLPLLIGIPSLHLGSTTTIITTVFLNRPTVYIFHPLSTIPPSIIPPSTIPPSTIPPSTIPLAFLCDISSPNVTKSSIESFIVPLLVDYFVMATERYIAKTQSLEQMSIDAPGRQEFQHV